MDVQNKKAQELADRILELLLEYKAVDNLSALCAVMGALIGHQRDGLSDTLLKSCFDEITMTVKNYKLFFKKRDCMHGGEEDEDS